MLEKVQSHCAYPICYEATYCGKIMDRSARIGGNEASRRDFRFCGGEPVAAFTMPIRTLITLVCAASAEPTVVVGRRSRPVGSFRQGSNHLGRWVAH